MSEAGAEPSHPRVGASKRVRVSDVARSGLLKWDRRCIGLPKLCEEDCWFTSPTGALRLRQADPAHTTYP